MCPNGGLRSGHLPFGLGMKPLTEVLRYSTLPENRTRLRGGQRRVNPECLSYAFLFKSPSDMLATCLSCEMSNLRSGDRVGRSSPQLINAHTDTRRSHPRPMFACEDRKNTCTASCHRHGCNHSKYKLMQRHAKTVRTPPCH